MLPGLSSFRSLHLFPSCRESMNRWRRGCAPGAAETTQFVFARERAFTRRTCACSPSAFALLDHADIGQAAEAVRPIEAIADEEFVARLEADEVGLELGAPLVRLVEQGAHPDP